MADGQRRKSNGQRRRIFRPVESLVTRSVEEHDVFARGIFNQVCVHAFLTAAVLLLRDSYSAGRLYLNMSSLWDVFGLPWEWLTTAAIECLQLGAAFTIYPLFLVWVRSYKLVGKPASLFFILLYTGYIVASAYCVFSTVFGWKMHSAGRIICCVEQMRLSIKSFSFIYENAYKVLYPWHKDDETGPAVWFAGQMEPQVGSFSAYIYFLFCPVVVYRDKYPRKPRNLLKALFYFIQFVAGNLLAYVLFRDILFPKSMHLDDIVHTFLCSLLVGLILLSLAHASLLHGWMNMAAELTGFADQEFYQDWWNSQDLAEYLRKWNPVIQDWLKDYAYNNFRKCVHPYLAIILVLMLSAVEHDILISCGVGYFVPCYVLMYGLGASVLFIVKPSCGQWMDQLIMGLFLCLGSAIQLTLYHVEVAARSYCPVQDPSWTDFFTLRLFECYWQFN